MRKCLCDCYDRKTGKCKVSNEAFRPVEILQIERTAALHSYGLHPMFLLSAPRFLDRQAFDHIDDDGNGTIELSEFKMWMGPI